VEVVTPAAGMMLLIGMTITVAFAASLASSIGRFSVEVWWELALLIAIMLLGHWLEMRAVGQRPARWPPSPHCCPTRPSW
jgi:Cu2+-exporting ATPase